jgi:hypothetical protein
LFLALAAGAPVVAMTARAQSDDRSFAQDRVNVNPSTAIDRASRT